MGRLKKIVNFFTNIPCNKTKHFFYGSLLVVILFPIIFLLTGKIVNEALWYTTIITVFIAIAREIYESLRPSKHEVGFLDFLFIILPSLLLTIYVIVVDFVL